jgi:hypothetical protein
MDTNTNQNAQQKSQGQCWPEGIERARRVAVKLHRLETILHAGLLCDEYAYAGRGGEDVAANMKASLVALDAALDEVASELGRALNDAPAFLLDGSWDRDRESGASRCLFGGRRRPARPGDGRGPR